MANTYFQFKKFTIHQDRCAMKVCTDSCLFGAWVASQGYRFNKAFDIGAGTGLLMLMLAQDSDAEIDGIEIEDKCYSQLQENLAASPWKNQLRAIHGDARNFEGNCEYDLVISNPPFFSNDLQPENASKQVAKHSTELTLIDLFNLSSRLLATNGHLALLMPAHRMDETERTAADLGLFVVKKIIVHHTEKHPAFRTMYIFGRNLPDVMSTDRIDIRRSGEYSPEFILLCQNYYLAL